MCKLTIYPDSIYPDSIYPDSIYPDSIYDKCSISIIWLKANIRVQSVKNNLAY